MPKQGVHNITQNGGLYLFFQSILKTPLQPFLELLKRDLPALAHIAFFTSLIIPLTEFIGLYCSDFGAGVVALVVFPEKGDSLIAVQLFFVHRSQKP